MKLLLSVLVSAFLISFVAAPGTISKKERKSATKFLKESQENALVTVSKLSEAQLKFKPSPDKWSVEECMMHIAATETGLWSMVDGAVNTAANPEKRSEIKWTDDDVMKNITARTS